MQTGSPQEQLNSEYIVIADKSYVEIYKYISKTLTSLNFFSLAYHGVESKNEKQSSSADLSESTS